MSVWTGVELVGRTGELAAAEHALEETRKGSARALGVIGEMGIGKTALLAAVGERARRSGMLVLAGRGVEHERDVPFSTLVDALDEYVATLAPQRLAALEDDLGAVLPAVGRAGTEAPTAAERFRHYRALGELLTLLGRERPLALLLDDLHWADEGSIEFVLHLLRRPLRGRVLLAFALRPVDPALRVLEAARGAPGWEELALEPLDDGAAQALLAGVRDRHERGRIAGDAAGNPLFLRELGAVAGRSDGRPPRTLVAAVSLELALLAPAPRALIEGAAVAGDRFDPELAAAAAAVRPDDGALDALVAADLVRSAGEGRTFAFRHPLVRRAVYDALPPAWRLAAHERVAAVLARRGAAPAVRAYHVERFARAGDEEAIALLCEAGAAAAMSAPATAARWYAAGLRLAGERHVERRVELLAGLAAASGAAGRLGDSRAALVELLGLSGPGTPQRLWLVASCAAVEGILGQHADARGRLLAELHDAPEQGRAGIQLGLATSALYTGDVRGMREWATRAAAATEDPLLLADAEGCAALGALWEGEGEPARRMLDRAAGRLRAIDDPTLATRLDCARQVAGAQLLAERYADAADTAARGLAIARRTRQGQPLVALLHHRAGALGNLLELDAARREIDAAEESARLQGIAHALAFALWQRAIIHQFQDATAEARRDAAEFAELAASLESNQLVRTGVCGTAAIGAADDPERCLHTVLRVGLDGVLPSWWAALLLTMVRCALSLGRHEDARRWAARARERAAALQLPASSARAAIATAEALLADDEPQRAAATALEAVATGEHSGALRDAAEARLLAGRALAAAGDTEPAVAVLQGLAADSARGGALGLSRAAGRELRRLGARPASKARRAADWRPGTRLSPREREIAELVAAGHSNKQVAATLHLSEKTVRNTLTRVYAKLEIRSRTQLARLHAN